MSVTCCSLVLAAALALGSGADEAPAASQGSARTQIAAILAREGPAEAAAAQLAALGAEAVPELFETLRAHLAATAGDGSDPLSESLSGALERIGRTAVVPVLEPHAAAGSEAHARRAVLVVLAACGRRADLGLAAQAAAPAGQEIEPGLIAAFERTARAILQADPAAHGELSWLVGSIRLEVAGAVVRATAEAGDARALEALVLLLGKVPDLDATILAHLARAARHTLPPGPEALTPTVRAYLTSPDLDLARAALQAVGQLEDAAAVEPCIELLESQSATLAETAHWALCRITGLGLPPDAVRWAAWYRGERSWLEGEAPEQFELLRARDPVTQRRALTQVAKHRLDRHRLAREVAYLLGSPDADLRRLACGVLDQLGSRCVTPDLVALLSDPDTELAQRAWRILRTWTGLDLPLDSPQWGALSGGA